MKKLIAAAAALALALSLTSCSGLTIFSNYRRLEDIELVRTVTADVAEGGVNASVYSDAGKESDPRMYERTASSIGVALGELQLMSLGRVAILSHTENMLIGEELAGAAFTECLDYVERYSEMRLDTGMLIVRGGKARDLVSGLSGSDTPASDIITGFAENIARVGEGYVFTCREILSSLAERGSALVMCVRGEETEDKLFEARGDLDLRADGLAVMNDGGISDFLDKGETLGSLLVLSKIKSGNIDVPVGDTVLTLSLDGFLLDVEPIFEDGSLERVDVDLSVQANIINLIGLAEITKDEYRKRAEEALSDMLQKAVESAIAKSQEMGVDFLGLEGFVRRSEPLKTEDMPTPFEELFPELEVRVKVKSIIRRTYDIMDPPQSVNDEEAKNPWENLIESLRDN